MDKTVTLLTEFERGLQPQDLSKSVLKAHLVGYGEISAIFAIEAIEGMVFKRMPLFESRDEAENYRSNYFEYCEQMVKAGLHLPPHDCHLIPKNEHLFVLYIGQKQYSMQDFCHRRIHTQTPPETGRMLNAIAERLNAVWTFNREKSPGIELAVDGQLSNWVWRQEKGAGHLTYIDTSTPLFKRFGAETMNPDLILKSAPGFLKAIIKSFLLEDVMNRYYQPREVYLDLVANLYKEQRPELIPLFLETVNEYLPAGEQISRKDIDRYYREDKFIWWFFLNARRLDRWFKLRVQGKPYEFLLPGKVKR